MLKKYAEKEGAAAFQLDKERFERLRKIARYELPLIHMEYGSTADAILSSYLLDKEYGATDYTYALVNHALYIHMPRALNGNMPRFIPKNMRGELRRVAYLLNKIEKGELSILVAKRNVKAWLDSDDNLKLRDKANDVLLYMYKSGYTDISYFSEEPYDTTSETQEEPPAEITKERSKYDRIRAKQKQEETFWKYAFVDLLQSEAFQERYAFIAEIAQSINNNEDDNENISSIFLADTKEKRDGPKKAPYQLGIKKIVLLPGYFISLNPTYVFIDSEEFRGPCLGTSAMTPLRMLDYGLANELHAEYNDMLRAAAADTEKVTAELLQPETNWTAERLNNRLEIERWLQEQNQGVNTITTFYQSEIDAMIKRYGTPYILYSYSESVRKLSYFNTLFDLSSGRYQPLVPTEEQKLRKSKKIPKVLERSLEEIGTDPAE